MEDPTANWFETQLNHLIDCHRTGRFHPHLTKEQILEILNYTMLKLAFEDED